MNTVATVEKVSRLYRARGAKESGGRFRAVDEVSFDLVSGQTLGLVGESGSGKSTVARLLLGMEPADEGTVTFGGVDISEYRGKKRRDFFKSIAMVFQDPYSALDPRWTIERIVSEPLVVAGGFTAAERRERALEALTRVGLGEQHLLRRPREFSGGQRQRIAIARALVNKPELIVCDESVSALDVSTQAQVLGLLNDLQEELGVAYLFISHDLHVVKRVSDRVAVMYLGRIVEEGPAAEVVDNPKHPYTAALISAAPLPDPSAVHSKERIVLEGSPPSVVNPPSGCMFRTRCPLAMPICAEERPMPITVGDERSVACHLHTTDKSAASIDIPAMMRAAAPVLEIEVPSDTRVPEAHSEEK